MRVTKTTRKVLTQRRADRDRYKSQLKAAVQEHIAETPGTVNRFESATLTRLNKAHWANAHGQSINNDLAAKLPVVQAHCQLEYTHNPLYEGVCNTFRDDVVGCDGPQLQVVSDDEAFNGVVETGWKLVFSDPDPSHRIGGVESMKTWVLNLLNAGSFINVFATVARLGSPITFGWKSIHPRRLVTPPEHSADPNVAFGCKSDDDGKPIEYYLDNTKRLGPYSYTGVQFKTVPAEAVQHCYMPVEGEQLTGYPLMTSTLQTAADLRDYDKIVMQSTKAAAALTPGLHAVDPKATTDYEPIDTDTLPFSPGEANVAPPGYAWQPFSQVMPGAQYVEFRHERGAELGLPIHMPMLVVFLTAAESNFSVAQYEGTVYCDGVGNVQGFIERRSLNPMVWQLITEMALKGIVRVPKKVELVWTWNVPAHANIEKFVKAIRSMVEDGLISPAMGSALLGYDWEKVVASRKRCAKDLEDAGLPPAPSNSRNPLPPEPEEGEEPPVGKPTTKKPAPAKKNARFSLTTR